MTPDDDRNDKHIDGLLRSYTDQQRELGQHSTRLDGHDREFGELRAMRREDVAAVMSALKEIDSSCGQKVDAVRKDIKDAAKDVADAKQRAALTVMQRVGLVLAALGPFVAALSLVLR